MCLDAICWLWSHISLEKRFADRTRFHCSPRVCTKRIATSTVRLPCQLSKQQPTRTSPQAIIVISCLHILPKATVRSFIPSAGLDISYRVSLELEALYLAHPCATASRPNKHHNRLKHCQRHHSNPKPVELLRTHLRRRGNMPATSVSPLIASLDLPAGTTT